MKHLDQEMKNLGSLLTESSDGERLKKRELVKEMLKKLIGEMLELVKEMTEMLKKRIS
jgi:hypothetical protein